MAEMKTINFMAVRRYASVFSIVLMIVAIGSLATRGLNLGLDFTGGTLVELSYSKPQPLQKIRDTLSKAGHERAVVVNLGAETDVAIRVPKGAAADIGQQLLKVLQKDFDGKIELRRVEFVGPQVGDELRNQAGLAVLLALLAVGMYIAARFQYKFSIGAVAALFHDVIITLGCFSLFQWEFDLTVLAAVLAIIGYSVNDTIVVFDRIREVFRKLRKTSTADIINISMTQTLDRTIGTSLTVILTLLALLLFGGDMIRGFSIALLIGVFFGTYSSTYVASSLLMTLGVEREDLLVVPVQKEGADAGRP